MIDSIIFKAKLEIYDKLNTPKINDNKILYFDFFLQNLQESETNQTKRSFSEINYNNIGDNLNSWIEDNKNYILIKKLIYISVKISIIATVLYVTDGITGAAYFNTRETGTWQNYKNFNQNKSTLFVVFALITNLPISIHALSFCKNIPNEISNLYNLFKTKTISIPIANRYFQDLSWKVHRWGVAYRNSEFKKKPSSEQQIALDVLQKTIEVAEKTLLNPDYSDRCSEAVTSLYRVASCRGHLPLTMTRLKKSHLDPTQKKYLTEWLTNHMCELGKSNNRQYRKKLNRFLLNLEKRNG